MQYSKVNDSSQAIPTNYHHHYFFCSFKTYTTTTAVETTINNVILDLLLKIVRLGKGISKFDGREERLK